MSDWLTFRLALRAEPAGTQTHASARVELQTKLAEQFRDVPKHQHELPTFHIPSWRLLSDQGQQVQGYRTAGELLKKLIQKFPNAPEYQDALSTDYVNLGENQAAQRFLQELVERFTGEIKSSTRCRCVRLAPVRSCKRSQIIFINAAAGSPPRTDRRAYEHGPAAFQTADAAYHPWTVGTYGRRPWTTCVGFCATFE